MKILIVAVLLGCTVHALAMDQFHYGRRTYNPYPAPAQRYRSAPVYGPANPPSSGYGQVRTVGTPVREASPIERARHAITPIREPTGYGPQPYFSFDFGRVRDAALKRVPYGTHAPQQRKVLVGKRYKSGFARKFDSDFADRSGSGSGIVIAEFNAERKADQEILKEFLQEASSDGQYKSGLGYGFSKPVRHVRYQPVDIEPAKIHVGNTRPTYSASAAPPSGYSAPAAPRSDYRAPLSNAHAPASDYNTYRSYN